MSCLALEWLGNREQLSPVQARLGRTLIVLDFDHDFRGLL